MIEPAATSAVCAAAAGVGLLMLRRPVEVSIRELSFPPDLRTDQVETLLGLVAGLPARARVTSRIDGVDGRIGFALESRSSDLAGLQRGIEGFAPGVRFGDEPAEPEARGDRFRAHVGWRGTHVLLRRDQPELAVAALLGALRGAGRHERLQLRIELRPVVRPKAPANRSGQRDHRDVLSRTISPTPSLPTDQLRQIRNQYAGPLLGVRIQLIVWAKSSARARQLLYQVVAALRARSGSRGRFSVRSHGFAWTGFGTMLAPPEIVSLLGWPLEGPEVPGLTYVRSPMLLPDTALPQRGGRLFGLSTWPGMEQREIHQPAVGALSHALLIGPTGSGKSELLARLLLDDLAAGGGALLVDLKGDTANEVLARIPAKRQRDVVVLDPSDRRPLPGLKAISAAQPELTADLWVGLFRNLFADSWGVRTERPSYSPKGDRHDGHEQTPDALRRSSALGPVAR